MPQLPEYSQEAEAAPTGPAHDTRTGAPPAAGRRARATGTAVLAALALHSLGWIARDFASATRIQDVWWMWSGLPYRAADGIWASSFLEPTLLVLYTVCAVTVWRSTSAPGVLATTGALTLALRLPGLWNLHSTWAYSAVPAGLREAATAGAVACCLLGAVLPVAALRLRGRTGGAPAVPPRRAALTAFALLTGVAAVQLGWQLAALHGQGAASYLSRIAGDRTQVTLLAAPDHYLGWVIAALSLTAAGAALRRTPWSRPLGLVAAGPVLALGLFWLSFTLRAGLLGDFGTVGPHDQFRLLTALYETGTGLTVLAALSHTEPAAA